MKKLLSPVLTVLLLMAVLAVPAWAADIEPGTGLGFYARDTANVLSASTEETLAEYNAALERDCAGAQLVVVTVSYLDEDADIAATRLMNDWGVGSASQSNGMLLLLAAKEYRGWLAVGDGIDSAFTSDMANDYLDAYFWDDVDQDRFDDAVLTLSSHLYDWYVDYYGVNDYADQSYGPDRYPVQQETSSAGPFAAVIVMLLLLVLFLWVIGAVSRFSRMRSWGYSGGFFPIFWFGGRRRYRDWYRRQPPPPPPGPGPGPGPGGFGGFGGGSPRPPAFTSRPSAPRGRGFGGRSSGGGGGRSGSSFRSSDGSFRSGGGGFRGGGGGGHSGGGGGGRR